LGSLRRQQLPRDVPFGVVRKIWSRLIGFLKRLEKRYDAIRRDLERRVALNRWYPHVPLGLAVLPLGLILSYRAALSMLGMSAIAIRLDELQDQLLGAHLGGLSDFVIGGLLIVTAFGLILRARMAWWLAVLGLITSLALRLLTEFGEGTHGLVMTYRGVLLLGLLLSRHHFPVRSLPAQTAMGIYFVVMFLACATMFTLRRGSHFEPEILDSVTALYFVVMTISTVGFGDITPQDSETRGFVLGMIVIGVLVIGSSISVFLLPLISNRLRLILGNREDIVNRTKHFVVIGTGSLARNTAQELEKRGQAVTIVLGAANEDPFYQKRDVVIGDATDLEILKGAGAERARGVLALSPDDASNGFIVLGVNELDPTIPTVAALNDPKNQSRLERTQPSILLSLQVLGGQLLAMALTGERVDESFLDSVLEIQTTPTAKGDDAEQ
jgi:voltage-gated potassium channel